MASESETMREEFEEWAATRHFDLTRRDDFYDDSKTGHAWAAWQAAWSRAPSAEAKDAERFAFYFSRQENRDDSGVLLALHMRELSTNDKPTLDDWRAGLDAAIAQQGAAAAQEVGRGD